MLHWLLLFAQVFFLTKWIGTVRPPCFFGNFLIFPTCRSSVFKMSFSLLSEPGLGSPIKSKNSFLFCATEFADKDAFLMIDGFAEVRFRRKPATCFWCRGQSVRVSSSSFGWNDISMKKGASFSRHLVSIPSRSVQESDISFSAAKDWPKSTTSIASTMRWSTEISQVVCQEGLCESQTSWNFNFLETCRSDELIKAEPDYISTIEIRFEYLIFMWVVRFGRCRNEKVLRRVFHANQI